MDLLRTLMVALFPVLENIEPVEVIWFFGAIAVLMITRRQFHPRYEFLYRWMTGFSVSVVIITIIASLAAGARISEVIWRSSLVLLTLSAVTMVVIRTWSSFEDLKSGSKPKPKKK